MNIIDFMFWFAFAVWTTFFFAWLTVPEPEYIMWMICSNVVLIILCKISGG